ncbi:MAG: hypothetical protein V8Q84_12500 [Bilophila sp.]
MKPALVPAPTVITCHSNADWDALSSIIGMTMLYPDSGMVFPGSMEKPLNEFFNETASYLYPFKNPKEIDPADDQARRGRGHADTFPRAAGARFSRSARRRSAGLGSSTPPRSRTKRARSSGRTWPASGRPAPPAPSSVRRCAKGASSLPVRRRPSSGSAFTATPGPLPIPPPGPKISSPPRGCAATAWT